MIRANVYLVCIIACKTSYRILQCRSTQFYIMPFHVIIRAHPRLLMDARTPRALIGFRAGQALARPSCYVYMCVYLSLSLSIYIYIYTQCIGTDSLSLSSDSDTTAAYRSDPFFEECRSECVHRSGARERPWPGTSPRTACALC